MASREMPKSMKYAMGSPVTKLFQRANTWVYRKSGGKLWGTMEGAPLLLLTTYGRKTGEPRTVPLIYCEDGSSFVVVASKGGWPTDPMWYRNLQANPSVEVQRGPQVRSMVARTADAAERARLWPRLLETYKPYADYQSWTDREIPLVILSDRN